jgi:hypothetical protein
MNILKTLELEFLIVALESGTRKPRQFLRQVFIITPRGEL